MWGGEGERARQQPFENNVCPWGEGEVTHFEGFGVTRSSVSTVTTQSSVSGLPVPYDTNTLTASTGYLKWKRITILVTVGHRVLLCLCVGMFIVFVTYKHKPCMPHCPPASSSLLPFSLLVCIGLAAKVSLVTHSELRPHLALSFWQGCPPPPDLHPGSQLGRTSSLLMDCSPGSRPSSFPGTVPA